MTAQYPGLRHSIGAKRIAAMPASSTSDRPDLPVTMVLAALSQLIGVDLPSFEGQSAGQLLMEGLAVLFLRRGMKG